MKPAIELQEANQSVTKIDGGPSHAGRTTGDGENNEPSKKQDEYVDGPDARIHEPLVDRQAVVVRGGCVDWKRGLGLGDGNCLYMKPSVSAANTLLGSVAFLSNTEDGGISVVVDDTTEVCFTSALSKEKTSTNRAKSINVKIPQEHLAFFMQFVNA
ncbi:hypothetical protein E3N88_15926 [Mikania micrantha]|uniref:Uncharacterized protein n=1 Tax=Mikania micrantha TaxID=192012 RepID=A0A5N6NZK1_9ASTR|nr:hypothetical protein E3N88_15926 [Mikania micrantha]